MARFGHRDQRVRRSQFAVTRLLLSGLNVKPDVRDPQVRAASAIHPAVRVLVPWPEHHANNHDYATQEAAVAELNDATDMSC